MSRRKICLLGAAPSSRKLAPFSDITWEIWACSPPNYDAARIDAWFELHNLDRKIMHIQNAPFINILKEHPRVYIAKEDKRFPKAIVYPYQEMVKKYGKYFFTSSLAWMMAMAIEQKPEVIGIWGVDMSAHEEYGYQRAGMHFFMQKAKDVGIKLAVPAQSDLLMPVPPYGFKEQWPMWWKQRARREELEGRLQNARNQIQSFKREEYIFSGALDDMNYMDNTWLWDTTQDDPFPEVKKVEPPQRINGNGKDATGLDRTSIEEPGSPPDGAGPEHPRAKRRGRPRRSDDRGLDKP